MGVFPHTHIKPCNVTFIVFKKLTLVLNCFRIVFNRGHVPTYIKLLTFVVFFKNKQIVFPLFLLFLHPQKKFPGPPITKERSRVAGTGYVRIFRSKNQSKVLLQLCTVLEQLLAANPQISEAQKNVSLMQKIQKRVQLARVVFHVCRVFQK